VRVLNDEKERTRFDMSCRTKEFNADCDNVQISIMWPLLNFTLPSYRLGSRGSSPGAKVAVA
jgi:hypothetical protein